MWRALRHLQLRSLSLRLSEYITKKRVDAPVPDDVRYADFLFVPSQVISTTVQPKRLVVLLRYRFLRVKVCHHGAFRSHTPLLLFLIFLSSIQKKAYFCQKEKWEGKKCKHADSRLITQTLFSQRYICCKARWRFIFVKWAFMWKFFKRNFALVISLNYAV